MRVDLRLWSSSWLLLPGRHVQEGCSDALSLIYPPSYLREQSGRVVGSEAFPFRLPSFAMDGGILAEEKGPSSLRGVRDARSHRRKIWDGRMDQTRVHVIKSSDQSDGGRQRSGNAGIQHDG